MDAIDVERRTLCVTATCRGSGTLVLMPTTRRVYIHRGTLARLDLGFKKVQSEHASTSILRSSDSSG